MPNNQNARKAVRQSEKNRLRNRAARTTLRNVVRKARELAVAPDAAAADSALRLAAKHLDRAAGKHTIHRNKAARLKSRLSKLAKKTAAGAAAPAAQ